MEVTMRNVVHHVTDSVPTVGQIEAIVILYRDVIGGQMVFANNGTQLGFRQIDYDRLPAREVIDGRIMAEFSVSSSELEAEVRQTGFKEGPHINALIDGAYGIIGQVVEDYVRTENIVVYDEDSGIDPFASGVCYIEIDMREMPPRVCNAYKPSDLPVPVNDYTHVLPAQLAKQLFKLVRVRGKVTVEVQ